MSQNRQNSRYTDQKRNRTTQHNGFASFLSPEAHEELMLSAGPLVISPDLSHYQIVTPFVILLETCQEEEHRCNIFQFTQRSYHSAVIGDDAMHFSVPRPLHQHSCIEIMYVLAGSVTNHVENQIFTYEAGQCCVMNKNIRHCEEFSGDFQAVFFMLRDEFITELLNEYHEMNQDGTLQEEENLILQLFTDGQNQTMRFDKVYLDCFPLIPADDISEKLTPLLNVIIQELITPAPGTLFFIKGAFSRLLRYLTDPALFCINRIHSESDGQEYLFSKLSHIMKSNHGRCTREELSAQLHYNGEYLNRIVKKYTGKTILEYGQTIYMEEARELLAGTDLSISAIIEELGFSNRSHFYRLFEKIYGETPLNYKRRVQVKLS